MSRKKVNADNIEAVVKAILDAYSVYVQDEIVEVAKELSKEGKSELRKTSPRRTGDYYRGWRIKTEKGSTFVHCTVYNATDYQLTHLLEKGHRVVRNGKQVGYAKAIPHIGKVQDWINEEFVKRTKEIIKRGGK